jgi:integral membrane protein (TIGR01906 family)
MKTMYKVIAGLVSFLIPVSLTFLGVRLVLTDAFLETEYRMPGFPADTYGFTLQDRLKWSKISLVEYLLNDTDISFLGNLTFPDGSSLFNERELSHMHDVKKVIQPAFKIGYSVWLLLIGLGLWAFFSGWWKVYMRGVWRGGWVTVILVALIGILAGINFWQFFSVFHGFFFAGGSWQFLYSDSLIRLFPLRFWEDVFLFVGILDVLGGLALGLGLNPVRKEGVSTGDIITENARRQDD